MGSQIKKILISLVAIIGLAYLIVFILVAAKGKALVIEQLESALGKEVSIGHLGLKLPAGLLINDLSIKDLAQVEKIHAVFSLSRALRGKLFVKEVSIVSPVITVKRVPSQGKAAKPSISKESEEEEKEEEEEVKAVIRHIGLRDGVVNFIDPGAGKDGVSITVEDITVEVNNLVFIEKPNKADFKITAIVPSTDNAQAGAIKLSGWVDYYKKDIQAKLDVEGIDALALSAYYSFWVDPQDRGIEQADFNFRSDISGENNKILAKCKLELANIKFKSTTTQESSNGIENIAAALLGAAGAYQKDAMALEFTIATKLDKPEFKLKNISVGMNDLLSFGVKAGKGKIEGATEQTIEAATTVIDEVLSVGKDLPQKLISDIFGSPNEEGAEVEETTEGEPGGTEINLLDLFE